MIQQIYLWYLRKFSVVITRKEAILLGLEWQSNVHGDFIFLAGCRSFWKDRKGHWYKVEALEKEVI